ncbi:uncharacterized protein DNG_02100 [Cephalotrichum gorgonifer]|uniref:Zn(2)-C6 fungal-type domain-containing protein n=1 Tax=Cephalotrichum gorgonifer TaxID=2041049 RepID=A0AAE8MTU5_9PEZI|nr:uncharacterized protein DNG_02100 [Cephalotrichum gorgonifer]
MVGIPGKSKGCNTCRRRKKGCDLERPVCGQCKKLNLHCAGYERETIWVNLSPDTGLVQRPKRTNSPTITLPDAFARSAYHERYLGMFWQSYLPAGRAFPFESTRFMSGGWMNELHTLSCKDNDSLAKKILLAISLATIGRRDKQPWMVENGIQLYGTSLAALAHQLETPLGLADDNNFVASKLLSLYEIASSLGSGKGAFLNEPEWRTIPWKDIPKTPKDFLGDIFAEVPGIFAELDELRTTTDADIMDIRQQALILKCQRLEREWVNWGREHTPTTSPIISGTAQTANIWSHFASATIMSAYWSTGIFILATLNLASGTQDLGVALARMDPRVCCRKLAEIIPTFLSEHSGDFGIHGSVSASIIALLYLDEVDHGFMSPEARSFYTAFSKNKNGKIIHSFVNSFRQQFSARGVRLFAPVFT